MQLFILTCRGINDNMIVMVELLILYILNKYDATIYKIQKLIDEMFYPYSKPSLGTINPALKRLEALSAVEYEEKMTDGGKLSKIYKITSFGIKYFKNSLLTFEFKNQSYLLNFASICLAISDILDNEEKAELLKNIKNYLLLYKIEIEKKLDDPYILYSSIQREVITSTIKGIDALIEVIK